MPTWLLDTFVNRVTVEAMEVLTPLRLLETFSRLELIPTWLVETLVRRVTVEASDVLTVPTLVLTFPRLVETFPRLVETLSRLELMPT
jgi:hypothetical protein